MGGEKEKIVPTIWDRFDKLESQIVGLKEQIDTVHATALFNNSESFDTRKVLRGYFKYRKDWSELIMKKSPYGSPLDTWMMISLHKFTKDALEKLDVGSARQTEKKEYKIINYCSFYVGGDANGDCQLYGSGDITKSRKCKDIYCHYKASGGNEPCPICFGDKLDDLNQIEDEDKRYHAIQDFINELLNSEGENTVVKSSKHNPLVESRGLESSAVRKERRTDTDSKPSESEKKFEFQLIEKFIPPRNIKCTDCMNNPVPELIEAFLKDYRLKKEEIKDYVQRSFYDCEENDALLQDDLFKDLEDKWEARKKR